MIDCRSHGAAPRERDLFRSQRSLANNRRDGFRYDLAYGNHSEILRCQLPTPNGQSSCEFELKMSSCSNAP